jgi:hypothetical protein
MKCFAYWLNGDGETLPVTTTHIAEVVRLPSKFGYSLAQIEAEYLSYKEPIGFEGKARHMIMANLIINNGWIRIRYKPRNDLWVVELKALNRKVKLLLIDFFGKSEIVGNYNLSSVQITELCGNQKRINYIRTDIRKISIDLSGCEYCVDAF